jgi:hypothetical protein
VCESIKDALWISEVNPQGGNLIVEIYVISGQFWKRKREKGENAKDMNENKKEIDP